MAVLTKAPAPVVEVEEAPRKSVGNPVERRRKKLFWWFVGPSLVLYLAFFVAPSLFTLYLSFHKWAGAGDMENVGGKNYHRLWLDPTFKDAFVNTLWILLGVGALTFLIAFGLTMLLRELPGRKAVRSIIFFPNLIAAVVLSILWGFLFQNDGLIDSVLAKVGVSNPPNWLGEENLFRVIMIGLVWTSVGFYTTILMAAVDQIPAELYEDAKLSGASAFQTFRHVTLPLMWDVVGVCAVLWTINAIKVFEFIYAFAGASGQMPSTKVWNTAVYMYGEAFSVSGGEPRYGSAAATAVVMVALTAVLIVLIRRVMRRDAIQF